MKPDLIHQILEALEDRWKKSVNTDALNEVWNDLIAVPDGAFHVAKKRLLTEYDRMPTMASVKKVLVEVGIQCAKTDARIADKSRGRVVKEKYHSPKMSEEEMDEYVRRSGVVARTFGPGRKSLVEAMVRDFPGQGWEDLL